MTRRKEIGSFLYSEMQQCLRNGDPAAGYRDAIALITAQLLEIEAWRRTDAARGSGYPFPGPPLRTHREEQADLCKAMAATDTYEKEAPCADSSAGSRAGSGGTGIAESTPTPGWKNAPAVLDSAASPPALPTARDLWYMLNPGADGVQDWEVETIAEFLDARDTAHAEEVGRLRLGITVLNQQLASREATIRTLTSTLTPKESTVTAKELGDAPAHPFDFSYLILGPNSKPAMEHQCGYGMSTRTAIAAQMMAGLLSSGVRFVGDSREESTAWGAARAVEYTDALLTALAEIGGGE